MANVTMRVEDGIATIVFLPEDERQKVNLLNLKTLRDLDAWVTGLAHEEAFGGTSLRGLIVTSGMNGNFIAGADIRELTTFRDPKE